MHTEPHTYIPSAMLIESKHQKNNRLIVGHCTLSFWTDPFVIIAHPRRKRNILLPTSLLLALQELLKVKLKVIGKRVYLFIFTIMWVLARVCLSVDIKCVRQTD